MGSSNTMYDSYVYLSLSVTCWLYCKTHGKPQTPQKKHLCSAFVSRREYFSLNRYCLLHRKGSLTFSSLPACAVLLLLLLYIALCKVESQRQMNRAESSSAYLSGRHYAPRVLHSPTDPSLQSCHASGERI